MATPARAAGMSGVTVEEEQLGDPSAQRRSGLTSLPAQLQRLPDSKANIQYTKLLYFLERSLTPAFSLVLFCARPDPGTQAALCRSP